jgi:hypothetical protein
MLVRLRAWLGYAKLDSPTSLGSPKWTSEERRTARQQIAAEELDAWQSDRNQPVSDAQQVTSPGVEDAGPPIETEEEARQRLLDGLPRRRATEG